MWDASVIGGAKLLEFVLRSVTKQEIAEVASLCFKKWSAHDEFNATFPEHICREIFNCVSLSPYTSFVENWTEFLTEVSATERLGPQRGADIFSYMLRHLVRHLTSYDLRTFHNRGANYPDALALDTFLRAFISVVDRCPEAFDGTDLPARLRRRALRQAWMIRKQLEYLPVPEQPTSPGENLRVLPEPYHRVPEEQILDPSHRMKRLFDGEPAERMLTAAARQVLRLSLRELIEPPELRELGTGVFLDRPLGVFKERGEADRTPLLSYEAISRSIAAGRLQSLYDWGVLPPDDFEDCRARLAKLVVAGIPVAELPDRERPGVVSLEEARRAAEDFVFMRSTRSSLLEFASNVSKAVFRGDASRETWFKLREYALIIRTPRPLLKGSPPPFMTAFDERLQPKLDFHLAQNDGQPVRYREWLGVESPAEGLRVEPHQP
jgi:hypothetical protein